MGVRKRWVCYAETL